MTFKASDLIVGRHGKVSRTALLFLVWSVFLIGTLGYSTYKNQGKIPDLPQSYVYLTLVFSGTYTARRYFDGKLELPKVP
jgi:hypothetical protein